MRVNYYKRIKYQYDCSQADSTRLFEEILRISEEIGIDEALSLLERCVTEKRLAWAKAHFNEVEKTDHPAMDGHRWFYETYLGLSTPEDGEIVEILEDKIVSRWWNPCPTLEACQKLGLDTRVICKKAYHRPVEELLKQLHSGLRFDRNYECLRPNTPFCEEIVFLDTKIMLPNEI
jgi:hypothetical protein